MRLDQITLHHRERVQLEQCGDLVHHPFDREVELGPTETPHGTGWAFVGEDDLVDDVDILNRVSVCG